MIEFIFSLFLNLRFNTATVSWYSCCNNTMASGQHFNPNKIFAAHKTLPFGTKVLFVYGEKSIVAEIKDRGPYIKGREFDLSKGAAIALGMKEKGVVELKYALM